MLSSDIPRGDTVVLEQADALGTWVGMRSGDDREPNVHSLEEIEKCRVTVLSPFSRGCFGPIHLEGDPVAPG